ncbi:MAG: hypothetical protein CL865_01765 [Cycloclasticus sp.]|nr:hypothetical protein [Cycloclasticus sp.]|tara:strand:+ start:2382 stop:2798 length:417 start_codon:yes stop_codon:yes gene_type:complete
MNRREFLLRTALASTAIATVPHVYSLANEDWLEPADEVLLAHPYYKIVYDIGMAPAVDLAGRARKYGLTAAAIEGDITELWNSDLRPHWKKGPSWIAGVTSPASLFLLVQMAKDEKHRITYRHELNSEACLWIIGPGA